MEYIALSKTQIGILEELSDNWYKFLHPYDISSKKGLALSSVYESLKDMVERCIILESHGRYKINFSNEIGWNFKRFNDAAKLYKLPKDMQSQVIQIKDRLHLFYGSNLMGFMIFGSAASFEIDNKSDIDFYILLQKKNPKLDFLTTLTSEQRKFHFIEHDLEEFDDAYNDGDDFILSLLKNNIILADHGHFLRYFFERDLPAVSIKIIHENEQKIKRLSSKLDKMIFQDQPLVFEKTKEYIKLKCRIFLLRSNTVPKSNKELMKLMREKYKKYHKAYETITRKNAKDTYIEVSKEPI